MSDAATATGQEPTATGDQQQTTDGQQVDGKGGAQGTQPTNDGKAGDGKATEVDYKFEAPEGIELDETSLTEFKDIAKGLKLSQEDAAKVVQLAVKREQQRIEQHANLVKGWADEVRNDKDIGGEKLTETLATAKKAIDLGPPELKDLLNSSGLGNHPAVVKWALAVGKALSEDRFVQGKAPADTRAGDAANRLYPTTANA